MLEVSCGQPCPSSICHASPPAVFPHPPAPPPWGRSSFPALPAWSWGSLCPGSSPQGITKAAQLKWPCPGGANPGAFSIHLPRVKESRKSHPCPLSPWTMCCRCGDGDSSTIPDPRLSHPPLGIHSLTITYSKGYLTPFIPSLPPCCLTCCEPILSHHQKLFFTPR